MGHNNDTEFADKLVLTLFFVSISGQTERRGSHSIPGEEKMFWRIQMSPV